MALAFNLVGTATYLRKALRREVTPHLVTWLLWALAPLVAFFAQVNEGIGLVSLVTLMAAVNPMAIFLVSVRRKDAHWSVTRFDLVCAFLSIAGLGLWLIYQRASYAVAFSIFSDALAAVPTYRKALSDPESESPLLYCFLSASALITLFTIRDWTFAGAGFVTYLAILGVSLATIILIGTTVVRRRRRPN